MMKFGAENKKSVWALGVLGVVAAIVLYTNVISDSSPAPAAKSAAKSAVIERNRPAEMPTAESAPATPARKLLQRARSDEFRPGPSIPPCAKTYSKKSRKWRWRAACATCFSSAPHRRRKKS